MGETGGVMGEKRWVQALLSPVMCFVEVACSSNQEQVKRHEEVVSATGVSAFNVSLGLPGLVDGCLCLGSSKNDEGASGSSP